VGIAEQLDHLVNHFALVLQTRSGIAHAQVLEYFLSCFVDSFLGASYGLLKPFLPSSGNNLFEANRHREDGQLDPNFRLRLKASSLLWEVLGGVAKW
jgi:hypothetical protein